MMGLCIELSDGDVLDYKTQHIQIREYRFVICRHPSTCRKLSQSERLTVDYRSAERKFIGIFEVIAETQTAREG